MRETIEKQKQIMVEQEAAFKKRQQDLRNRLKDITNDYHEQRARANALNRELNRVKNLVKEDALEQLRVQDQLLKSKMARVEQLENRLAGILAHSEMMARGFHPESWINRLLALGYHQQGRYFLLGEISTQDWRSLLGLFEKDGWSALERLRPLFAPWIARYHAVFDVIEASGFQVRPLSHVIDHGISEKSVYIYHDVHAWDILPALGMALANRDRGHCTTFCLNIDQAKIDIANEDGYRIFGTLAGDHVDLGLHCNPFASWIRMDIFNASEQAFRTWYESPDAARDIEDLLTGKSSNRSPFAGLSKKDAQEGSWTRLATNFDKLKSFYPQARIANHHGDIVNKLYQDKRMDYAKDEFLFVTTMLRSPQAREVGILTSPTAIRRKHKPVGLIYGEIVNQSAYLENLKTTLDEGLTIQLINHPGAISNNGLTINLDFAARLEGAQHPRFSAPEWPDLRQITDTGALAGADYEDIDEYGEDRHD